MLDSDFHAHVDDALIAIEEAIDENDYEIDCDISGGVLTLSFDNGTKIVVNRQTSLKQLWVAARSGGFHFDYDEEARAWVRTGDGEELFSVLSQTCSEQAGKQIKL